MATSPAAVRALLGAHDLRPSRALGQHFLADANTARRIARLAGTEAGDAVVEIGPGVGSLTVALCDAGASVTAIEIDRRLLPALRETVADRDVRIVPADALRVDWADLLGTATAWKLVSNLPYNVATPLVLTVLEEAPVVGSLLVMVQREVGERLAAGPGDAGFGAVSVKVAYRAEARIVGRVPPTVFVPRPHVESVLVRLDRRTMPPVDVDDAAAMFALVDAGFATRRKTLRRALRGRLGAAAAGILEAAGIDPEARAETLDLEAWASLAREVARR